MTQEHVSKRSSGSRKRSWRASKAAKADDSASTAPASGQEEPELFKVRLMEVSYLETEFRILRSLIPGLASRANLSELEIIDACVSYIESLQHQLHLHDPGLLLLSRRRSSSSSSTSTSGNEENDEDAAATNSSSTTSSARRRKRRRGRREEEEQQAEHLGRCQTLR